MQTIIELKSKDEGVIHTSDEQKEQSTNEELLTLDTMERMIEEAFTELGLKIVDMDDKVGQSSVTFYPKQKKRSN